MQVNQCGIDKLISVDHKYRVIKIICDNRLIYRKYIYGLSKFHINYKVLIIDFTNYKDINKLKELIGSSKYKILLIKDSSGYPDELKLQDIKYTENKLILRYKIICDYTDIKDSICLMVQNEMNNHVSEYKNINLDEHHIQEFILNILYRAVGVSELGLEEERENYIRKYISKRLRINKIEPLSTYRITKEIILKERNFEPDYNTNIFKDTEKSYDKYISKFTPNINNIDEIGVLAAFIYINLGFKYKDFNRYIEKYENVEMLKINLAKYIERNYSVYDGREALRNVKFEEDCFEQLSCIHRISLISNIVKNKSIESEELNYSDLAHLLRIKDVDYSKFIIEQYILNFNGLTKGNRSLYIKDAVIYQELITNIIETSIEEFNEYDISIKLNSEFKSVNEYNIYGEIDINIYKNILQARNKLSKARDNSESIPIKLFNSDMREREELLYRFIRLIYNIYDI